MVDRELAAAARDEPALDVVFDADLTPEELAGSIARRLMWEVAECRTALSAELVLSDFMGITRLACPPNAVWDEQSEAVDALMREVTVITERDGSPAALALLRVISVIAVHDVSKRAAVAARRLADAGVPDRPWARLLGRPTFVKAWRYADIYGFQESVSVIFDYASREHVVSVLIDHPLGGGVKDSWVAEGRRVHRFRAVASQQTRENDDTFVEDLAVEQAHDLLRVVLGNPTCPEHSDQIQDVACYLPVIAARVSLLGAMAKGG